MGPQRGHSGPSVHSTVRAEGEGRLSESGQWPGINDTLTIETMTEYAESQTQCPRDVATGHPPDCDVTFLSASSEAS